MILFRSDPQPASSSKVEMDCRRRSVDLQQLANERRSADAPKRVADYIDHRSDPQCLHCLQSTEGFGNAHLFPGWEWEYNWGLREGALGRRIDDLDSEDSERDSQHCRLENSGSGTNVGSAGVHRKDSAGRWQSSALEDFAEEGSCLAGMEANNHSRSPKISSRSEAA